MNSLMLCALGWAGQKLILAPQHSQASPEKAPSGVTEGGRWGEEVSRRSGQ